MLKSVRWFENKTMEKDFYHKFSFFRSAEGIFMLFQFIFSIKRELNKGKDPVKLNIA